MNKLKVFILVTVIFIVCSIQYTPILRNIRNETSYIAKDLCSKYMKNLAMGNASDDKINDHARQTDPPSNTSITNATEIYVVNTLTKKAISYKINYVKIVKYTNHTKVTAYTEQNITQQNTGVNYTCGNSINWTILLTVSNGFHDMFNNWWYHFRKLQLQVPVIMIAEDSETLEKYKNQSDLIVLLGDNDIKNLSAFDYNTENYKKMVSKRAKYISFQLAQGVNILYTDIDTVWKRDPRPYFTGNCEIWIALDGITNYCTGFMAIPNNENSRDFIREWQKELFNKNQLNQPIFNKILKTAKVKNCPLPMTVFTPGNKYFKGDYKGDVVFIHNNWIIGHQNKVERFKKYGLWHPELDFDAQ